MRPPRPRTTTAAGALAQATAVVLLAALGFLGMGTGPAEAADGDDSWAVTTASNDFGADRQNYDYTIDPGGQLKDGLVVVNHGTTPLHLAVYAADGFTAKGGQLDLVTKDAKSTRVGVWVHPDQSDVTVQPGKSAEVPFTVTLPDDAAPGEYMGGIVTSPIQAGEADGTDANQRRGIRIRLRVGGELSPSLSVEDLNVRYSGTPNPFGKGDATVTYTIHNTGNAILTARQEASISGPFGSLDVRAGQIKDSSSLLPGDTWKVSVPVHGVTPALRLTGKVTLTPLITDASGSIAPLAAVETTTHAWTIPWALLLLLVVVLCGIVVAALTFRRRRRQAELREDSRVQALQVSHKEK
ncbi:WxL protein peptidoglycan domain-containing protein [Streptosporangium sp. 'caverna']|uniref:COG1470 family protein n=1 Tax=Streptosporangium sp. 'caverna' TaxID=2202249 RepID=UPI000D7DBEF4|nr:DUF916 domain-containing protein [Streptosporangium sp. 'caverna']AWS47948.1 DUF916 domain-containing protein [Streptosporangium sp. 'caverna']